MEFGKRWALGLVAAVALSLMSGECAAQTMYITDLVEITMRTGRGVGNKIVAMLESGEKVKLLEANDDWSFVENGEGRRGWVLTRFLTGSEPKSSLLEKLRTRHDELSERAEILEKENERLSAENETLQAQLEKRTEALDSLDSEYRTLAEESSEFTDLKTSEKRAREEARRLSQKAGRLESELAELKARQSVRWFAAGAAVLLTGFLIGLASRRNRRRSSLV